MEARTIPAMPCLIAAQFTPKKALDRNLKTPLCGVTICRESTRWAVYGTDGFTLGRIHLPADHTDDTFTVCVPDDTFKGIKNPQTLIVEGFDFDKRFTVKVVHGLGTSERECQWPHTPPKYEQLIPECWDTSDPYQWVFNPALMARICKIAAEYGDGKIWHSRKSRGAANRFDCELEMGGLLTCLLMPIQLRERPSWLGNDPAVEAEIEASIEAKAEARRVAISAA